MALNWSDPALQNYLDYIAMSFGGAGALQMQQDIDAWVDGNEPSQFMSMVMNTRPEIFQVVQNAYDAQYVPPTPVEGYAPVDDRKDDDTGGTTTPYQPPAYVADPKDKDDGIGTYTPPSASYEPQPKDKDDGSPGLYYYRPPDGSRQEIDPTTNDKTGYIYDGPPEGYIGSDWIPHATGPAPAARPAQFTQLADGTIVPFYPETGQQQGQPPPDWMGPQSPTYTPPTGANPYGSNNVVFDPTKAPQWYQAAPGLTQDITPTDWLTQRVINQALPYMDPWTRASAQQWLYRDNPRGFAGYQNVDHTGGTVPYDPAQQSGAPTPMITMQDGTTSPGYDMSGDMITLGPNGDIQPYSGGTASGPNTRPAPLNAGDPFNLSGAIPLTEDERMAYIAGDRIGNIRDSLQFEDLYGGLNDVQKKWLAGQGDYKIPKLGDLAEKTLKSSQGVQAANQAKSSLAWLQEALDTAQRAAPGATRAQQTLSMEHLDTLFKEAAQDPQNMSSYQTLFENLVNPVTWEQPLTGVLGTTRSVRKRKDDYKRGGLAYRNMSAL